MTYQPNFDIDREYGEVAEDTVREVLAMTGDQIEVKHKRYEDWSFYVEVAQAPLGSEGAYKNSGINVTTAAVWAYEINSTGIIVLIPVDRLKRAARSAPERECVVGDNPTKGRLVGADQLFTDLPEVEW